MAVPRSVFTNLRRYIYFKLEKQEKERTDTTGKNRIDQTKTPNLNNGWAFFSAYVIIFRKPNEKEYKCRDSVYNPEHSQDRIQQQTRLL